MSNLVCPECGSTNIMTERRVNGYHVCLECHNFWSNGVKPTLTVFQQVTQSPERLADTYMFNHDGKIFKSLLLPNMVFNSREEAHAATVARLKEVAE